MVIALKKISGTDDFNSIESSDPLSNQEEEILNLKDNYEDFVQLMIQLFKPIYQSYANPNGLLSFENCFLFLKEFEVFPNEVSLPYLKDLFNYLSNDLMSSGNSGKIEYDSEIQKDKLKEVLIQIKSPQKFYFIELKRFVYMVCLISYNLKSNATHLEKILFMIRKMSFSNGIEKAQIKRGITL